MEDPSSQTLLLQALLLLVLTLLNAFFSLTYKPFSKQCLK